jgi:hypothetical protein
LKSCSNSGASLSASHRVARAGRYGKPDRRGQTRRPGHDPISQVKKNYAFFQIVILAYNIWRYMKMIAKQSVSDDRSHSTATDGSVLTGIMNNTARIARLKLLIIAAKVVKDGKWKI